MHCNVLYFLHQLTDGDGNLLVSEDDIGHYQCSNSDDEMSVGYHLDVEGCAKSAILGMCCLFVLLFLS